MTAASLDGIYSENGSAWNLVQLLAERQEGSTCPVTALTTSVA